MGLAETPVNHRSRCAHFRWLVQWEGGRGEGRGAGRNHAHRYMLHRVTARFQCIRRARAPLLNHRRGSAVIASEGRYRPARTDRGPLLGGHRVWPATGVQPGCSTTVCGSIIDAHWVMQTRWVLQDPTRYRIDKMVRIGDTAQRQQALYAKELTLHPQHGR